MKENNEKSFTALTDEFVNPIRTWQHKKPAKRNAFLLFYDDDAGKWCAFMFGNERAKYPMATVVKGLDSAMKAAPELYGWIRASVRFVEREQKKQSKQRTHGTDSL